MPGSAVETTVLQIDPPLPRVYVAGSRVAASRAARAARRVRSVFVSAPHAAAAAAPSDRPPTARLVMPLGTRRRRNSIVVYQHATATAQPAAPDYRANIHVQA